MFVHGFHRLSDFWSDQSPKGRRNLGSGPPLIHPGFLNAAAIHGILTGNWA